MQTMLMSELIAVYSWKRYSTQEILWIPDHDLWMEVDLLGELFLSIIVKVSIGLHIDNNYYSISRKPVLEYRTLWSHQQIILYLTPCTQA